MPTNVKVDFSSADDILRKHGFQRGGPVQKMFTNEIKRISNPYVPFDRGVLSGLVKNGEYDESLIYYAPYARYLWYGKLMVSPTTGSAWAKYGEQKVLKEPPTNLQYQGAPLRGARWVQRAWIDHGDEVIKGIQKYVDSGGSTIG